MSAVLQPVHPQLRPMKEADLGQVIAIEERAYDFPWSRTIFADCLRASYSCWVMASDTEILGYAVLSASVGEAHVLNICIDREYRGHGHGSRMLSRLVDLARWHHARTLFLEVRPSNVRAVELYVSFGFRVVGRRPNYYPAASGREDALIMSLRLVSEEGSSLV